MATKSKSIGQRMWSGYKRGVDTVLGGEAKLLGKVFGTPEELRQEAKQSAARAAQKNKKYDYGQNLGDYLHPKKNGKK